MKEVQKFEEKPWSQESRIALEGGNGPSCPAVHGRQLWHKDEPRHFCLSQDHAPSSRLDRVTHGLLRGDVTRCMNRGLVAAKRWFAALG
jgi:hypothetical protein